MPQEIGLLSQTLEHCQDLNPRRAELAGYAPANPNT